MTVNQKELRNILVLSITFIITSFLVFAHFGVKNVSDSHRYLNYASDLQAGFYYDKHNFWYIGYIIFILIVRTLTGSHNELILIMAQYLYSFVGLIFLYRTIGIVAPNKPLSPLIVCLLYFLTFEIYIWNSYILCESFYYNNIVITLYFLAVTIILKKVNLLNITLTAFFILLTFLSKPTGIVLGLSLGVTAFIMFWINSKTSKTTKSAILIGGISIFSILLNKMLETFLIIENYQLGEVVYGISTLPKREIYNALIVPVPELNTLPTNFPPLIEVFYFISSNIYYWSLLFFKKLYYFLMHIRPYWSLKHNIYNLTILAIIYTSTLRQIFHSNFSLRIFSITYIGLHSLVVGITTVDWDGRFFLPLFPVLLILSAQGMAGLKIPLTKRQP